MTAMRWLELKIPPPVVALLCGFGAWQLCTAVPALGFIVADGKETREFDGRHYVMERGLFADLAIIHAWQADPEGNLVYRMTARNFNPMMATAAKITVAEVEEMVPQGALDADNIHTPGIFVKRMITSSANSAESAFNSNIDSYIASGNAGGQIGRAHV